MGLLEYIALLFGMFVVVGAAGEAADLLAQRAYDKKRKTGKARSAQTKVRG